VKAVELCYGIVRLFVKAVELCHCIVHLFVKAVELCHGIAGAVLLILQLFLYQFIILW
jgi:hypothetical protein